MDEIQVSGEAAARERVAGSRPAVAPSALPGLAAREAARGPIEGYVARTSIGATKTATPLVETPQAISVIGAKQIRDQNAETLDQALNYTPGVRGQTFGFDPRNDWFVLRGFKAQDTGYFLDGLQLFSFGFSTFQVEPWGLERIEVLRGPTASLYGGGNPGGIINAVSKRPTFTNFGVVEAGVNEFGNVYGAFDVGGVGGGERNDWSYRVAGLGRLGGTQVDFTDFNRTFIAPSLTYRPDGATSLTFLGQYTATTTRSQNFLPYEGTVIPAAFGRISNRFFSSDPNSDRFRRDQALVGYEFEHAFDPNTIFRQNFRFSTVDVLLDGFFGYGYIAPTTPTSGLIGRGRFYAHDAAFVTAVDNNLEHRFETGPLAHDLIVGLDYKHYGQNQNNGYDNGAPIDVVAPVYGAQPPVLTRYAVGRNTFDQLGLYAQDQIKVDRFTLLLGLRYDLLQQSFNDKITVTNQLAKETGKFSGRVGLIYNLVEGFGPYVSYSTSFNPLIVTSAAGGLARPETGEQYEVGIKYQSPTLPLAASVALFDLTRSNVPVTDTNVIFQVQTGEQNARGIEAEVTASLAEGLSLIGAYTQYDLRITKDAVVTNIGKTPTEIPEQFASLWLDYTIPAGPYRGLGIGAGVRYVGTSFATADNVLKVPEIYVGDLNVHYETGPWRAALGITNFTDEKYVASCTLISACYYAERRRTTASLAYRW